MRGATVPETRVHGFMGGAHWTWNQHYWHVQAKAIESVKRSADSTVTDVSDDRATRF